jgi:hypothetical protein
MGELYLGMTRGEVERVLHRHTPVREDAQPACGQYASTVILGGVKLEIQWSDNTPARTVDSLYTVLVRPESIASATGLAKGILNRLPQLVRERGGTDSVESLRLGREGDENGQSILITTGSEQFVYIAYNGCFD